MHLTTIIYNVSVNKCVYIYCSCLALSAELLYNVRIINLQNEVPGLLEILRTYTVYGVLKRHGWRQHIFQIKNGYLRFFNGTKVSKNLMA